MRTTLRALADTDWMDEATDEFPSWDEDEQE